MPQGAGEQPPHAVLLARTSLAAHGDPRACGFHLLPPLDEAGGLVELHEERGEERYRLAPALRFGDPFTAAG